MYYNKELIDIYQKMKSEKKPLTAFYKNPYYEYENYYNHTISNLRNSGIVSDEPDASYFTEDGYFDKKNLGFYSDAGVLQKMTYRQFQLDMLDVIEANSKLVLTGPKQTGKMIMILIFAITNIINIDKKPQIHIFQSTNDKTNDVIGMFLSLYSSIPFEAQIGIKLINKNSVQLENGTMIILNRSLSEVKKAEIDTFYYLYNASDLKLEDIEEYYNRSTQNPNFKKIIIESNFDGLNGIYRFRLNNQNINQFVANFMPKNMSKEQILSEYKYYIDPLSDKYPRQLEDAKDHMKMRRKMIELIKYEGFSQKDKQVLLTILDKM